MNVPCGKHAEGDASLAARLFQISSWVQNGKRARHKERTIGFSANVVEFADLASQRCAVCKVVPILAQKEYYGHCYHDCLAWF